jgi:hypothetical protein
MPTSALQLAALSSARMLQFVTFPIYFEDLTSGNRWKLELFTIELGKTGFPSTDRRLAVFKVVWQIVWEIFNYLVFLITLQKKKKTARTQIWDVSTRLDVI